MKLVSDKTKIYPELFDPDLSSAYYFSPGERALNQFRTLKNSGDAEVLAVWKEIAPPGTQRVHFSGCQRHFDYDGNGNLIQERVERSTADYSYNARNRMKGIQMSRRGTVGLAGFESGSNALSYTYDALGACRTYASRLDFCPFSLLPRCQNTHVAQLRSVFVALHQEKIIKNRLEVLKSDRLLGRRQSRTTSAGEHTLYRYGDFGLNPMEERTQIGSIPMQLESDLRVDALNNAAPTRYRRYEPDVRPAVSGHRNRSFLIAGSRALAEIDGGGNQSYYTGDFHGTVQAAFTVSGQLEDSYGYDVFGSPLEASIETDRRGYVGKPFDPLTGLYNYGYRDYRPELGRFTTVDPIRDGMNWYVYTGNDPVNWVDPFGLFSTKDFILGTLQVIGGVFEVGVSYATGVAAEVASVGLLSVPVAILVTAGTLDGLRSLVEGIAKITTSFDDDKDPISIPQEITGSIAESFGASEETIEKVKNITDAAETVGELLMPGKAVIQGVSILIDKTGVADPLLESIDDAVNQPSKPDENGMNKENF